MNLVATRLKELRAGRSQAEVAKLLGIKQTAWSRYENDAAIPGGEMILQICSTFAVSSDWLLGLTDERTPGGAVTSDARIAELEKKVIRLEGENSALQKALAIVGGHRAQPAKTGGSSATKTA